jgi:hypothetical protein
MRGVLGQARIVDSLGIVRMSWKCFPKTDLIRRMKMRKRRPFARPERRPLQSVNNVNYGGGSILFCRKSDAPRTRLQEVMKRRLIHPRDDPV